MKIIHLFLWITLLLTTTVSLAGDTKSVPAKGVQTCVSQQLGKSQVQGEWQTCFDNQQKSLSAQLQKCYTDKMRKCFNRKNSKKAANECFAEELAQCYLDKLEKVVKGELGKCFSQHTQKSIPDIVTHCLPESVAPGTAHKSEAANTSDKASKVSIQEETIGKAKPGEETSDKTSTPPTNNNNTSTPVTEKTAPQEKSANVDKAIPVPVALSSLQNEVYPPDIKRIKEKGEIVVAMLAIDTPPFFFHSKVSGKLRGLDTELAEGIAGKLGVKLKLNRNPKTFNEVVETVMKGDADIAISKISRTLERSQKVLFTEPYITFRHGLLVNRLKIAQMSQGQDPRLTVKELQGKLGIITASSYVGFAKQKFPKAEIVEYKNWAEIIDAVSQGDIVAAYRDELEVKRSVYGNPEVALKVQTVVLTDTEDAIAIAVGWKDIQLLYWINQYLHSLQLKLTADELLKRYPEIFQ